MKKIELNGNDIIIADIVTKQEYNQNRIKYDSKYYIKELYNKFFLIERNNKSKILFTTYLFNLKNHLKLKEGALIIADYQMSKDIFFFGTLENPLDSKSLLKVEYTRDSYYDNNILTFANWIKFFSNETRNTYVVTNNVKKFKETLEQQELNNYKIKFIKKEDIEKINSTLKPVFTNEDKISIYLPSAVLTILLFFVINFIGDNIIKSDIDSSEKKRKETLRELSLTTQKLQDLKNLDYYKNRDYYMKLSERKIYTKAAE